MELDVEYGGGCKQHEFTLSWEGSFLSWGGSCLDSLRPLVSLLLLHDAHGDTCEGLVSETLTADLTPIKKQGRVVHPSGHGDVLLGVFAGSRTSEATYSF